MRKALAHHRHARTVARVAVVALLAAMLQTLALAPAPADSGPANVAPVGDVNFVVSNEAGRVSVRGWAFDPNVPDQPIAVHVYVGGYGIDLGPATVSRPDVAAVYPQAGPNHGFEATFDVPGTGTLSFEVYGIDANAQPNAMLEHGSGTVAIADPTPTGAVESISSSSHRTIDLKGWASDPNAPAASVAIEAYVGGSFNTPGVDYHGLTANLARTDGRKGFAGQFTTTKTGPQDVYVYAKNVPGTPGTDRLIGVVRVTIVVDTTPPETTITSYPQVVTPQDVVRVEFTANEPKATFECRWDTAAFTVCQPGQTVSLTPGQHTVAVRARDAAGNVDPTPALATISVTDYVIDPPPPAPARTLAARAVKKKSKLRIDVGPDSASADYEVAIQRKVGKRWRKVMVVRTRGDKDVAVVNVRRGKYRAVLLKSAVGAALTSKTVRIRR